MLLMRILNPRWCAGESRWQMQGEIVAAAEADLAFFTANADIATAFRKGDFVMEDGRPVELTVARFDRLREETRKHPPMPSQQAPSNKMARILGRK